MLTTHVDLGTRSYYVHTAAGLLAEVVAMIEEAQPAAGQVGRTALIVTDTNIAPLYANALLARFEEAGWKASLAIQPAGEQAKSLEEIERLYDALIAMQADRSTTVVALGGGVVGDAAGFAAASYVRGLPFVQVPTSLLAAVDSSVGGKVGVNHPQAKNMIGAFHQPLVVLVDIDMFHTLPPREFAAGMAEVVKYGVILDPEFFTWLEQNVEAIHARQPEAIMHVVERSCRLKADVVEEDEYERTGLRAALNYGHTFGHAYEALSGYGVLLHGEAVSLGMMDAARLAVRRGLMPEEFVARQEALLKAFDLPVVHTGSRDFTIDDVIGRMRLDKKTVAGQLRFVLPTRLGHVQTFRDVPEEDVRAVLETALK